MKNAWKATSAIGGKQIHSFGPKKRGSTGADSSISGDGINTTLQQLWCLHDSVRCVVETEMRSFLEAHLIILIFLDSLTSHLLLQGFKKCSCYFECSILVVSLSVPEHNCLRHGSQRNSTINEWRTYISPFPPNQSLQLILDLDDPNKINTSIFSAVSSCVLWRLRLPLVLLFCNYLFPCRPQKTSFPRKPSLKIIARSYSWLIPIIVVWTILHNICILPTHSIAHYVLQ